MEFDFTSLVERHGKDALAIDGLGTMPPMSPSKPDPGFDAIPMWVADMNFATAPSVTKAIAERVCHPLFGYFSPTDEYYHAIIDWHHRRNGMTPKAENIGYHNGVLGGVISALNVLCSKGDKILLHSPTYIGFTMSLDNNGYHIVHSPLKLDSDTVWRMDYENMESLLRAGDIHAAIFCSPHNPTGRVWEEEEIRTAMSIFEKYDIPVISDEIWSDLILPGYHHVPTQSVSDYARNRTIALYAPSKTFNLAGLVGSYHIIYDKSLRSRIEKESSLSHYNEMNVLSMHALIGGYSKEGEYWLEELLRVIDSNVDTAVSYLASKGLSISRPQGTYMLFADCGQRQLDSFLESCWKVGVAVQDGRIFHGLNHIRINLALPHQRLKEALNRLDKYVFK